MNKQKLLLFLCTICFAFLGCNQTTVSVTPEESPTTSLPILISTPSPIPSPSPTVAPSPTITPTLIPSLRPTTTFTPSPTHTATFDAAHASTATLAPAAQCPQENPGLVPSFIIPTPTDIVGGTSESKDVILDFLNRGGSRIALIDYLIQEYKYDESALYITDLNNDDVADLLVRDGNIRIYSCVDSEYSVIFEIEHQPFIVLHIVNLQDINLNGIPEIILGHVDLVPVDKPLSHQILEWHGKQFEFILGPNHECLSIYDYSERCIEETWVVRDGFWGNLEPLAIQDIDGNGTQEFIINDGIGQNLDAQYNGPWRVRTSIFMWNGSRYLLFNRYLESPTYRFQALQDADFAVLQGKYDEAIDLYHQVISSDTLEWWTQALQSYELDVLYNPQIGLPTPTPPAPDPDEYGHLAAYAYYRMMILQAMLGDLDAAQEAYNDLQENFPAGVAGNIYAELAYAFWLEYQASLDTGPACDSAIAFTTEHEEEVLFYIGSIIHGYQSLQYTPQDVCPFR